MTTLIDNNLHLNPSWDLHVGPAIGGVPPTLYGTSLLSNNWRKFFTHKGPKFSNFLAAIHRPLPLKCEGAIQLSLQFTLICDADSTIFSQAKEFDSRISIAGLNYNHSMQFNDITGKLQISGQTGEWIDTPYSIEKFEPYLPYEIKVDYQIDTIKKFYRTTNMSINGNDHPLSCPELKPENLGWVGDTVSFQVQLDVNDISDAGGYGIYITDARYTFTL